MKIKNYQIVLLVLAALTFSCKSSRVPTYDPRVEVVSAARQYIGIPYAYGGTSSRGMDCSGLLLKSFEAINQPIPRTTKDLSKTGKKVKLKKLQKGDLVFFKAVKGRKKVTHVGLVTEVNGKNNIRFIHSSTSRGVIEENLMTSYYQKIFLQARRII